MPLTCHQSAVAGLVLGLLWPVAHAEAAGPPAELRGKNLRLSWTDSRTQKALATGQLRSLTQNSSVTVYIGTEGRFFSRMTRDARRVADEHKDVSGDGRNFLSWRSDGNSIFADQKFTRGARRLVVTFDAGFGTCKLQVLHGKEAGSSKIQFNRMGDGVAVELESVEVTSTSCAIGSGNPFS